MATVCLTVFYWFLHMTHFPLCVFSYPYFHLAATYAPLLCRCVCVSLIYIKFKKEREKEKTINLALPLALLPR